MQSMASGKCIFRIRILIPGVMKGENVLVLVYINGPVEILMMASGQPIRCPERVHILSLTEAFFQEHLQTTAL